MNQFLEWCRRIFASWKFWIVVPPWDVGVRIRLGKVAHSLHPGFHWRLPILDQIVLVNTRLRIVSTPNTTLSVAGKSGVTRVISAVISYRIVDPVATMMAFERPIVAVIGIAQSHITERKNSDECLQAMQEFFSKYGIQIGLVKYIEDVEVRTFRLLQSEWKISDESYSSQDKEGRY